MPDKAFLDSLAVACGVMHVSGKTRDIRATHGDTSELQCIGCPGRSPGDRLALNRKPLVGNSQERAERQASLMGGGLWWSKRTQYTGARVRQADPRKIYD
jgi:hypothetical protein